jgi:hypothetical protein
MQEGTIIGMIVRHAKSGKEGEVIEEKTDAAGRELNRVAYKGRETRPVWGLAENYEIIDGGGGEQWVTVSVAITPEQIEPDAPVSLSDMIALDRAQPCENPRKCCPVRTTPSGCPISAAHVSPAWNTYRLAWETKARWDVLYDDFRRYSYFFRSVKSKKKILNKLKALDVKYRAYARESVRLSKEEKIKSSIFLPHVTKASPGLMWALMPSI